MAARETLQQRTDTLRLCVPLPPMSRAHVNLLFGFRADPAADNTTAREGENVRAILLKDRQLKLAVERRGRDRLPLHIVKLVALQLRML